MAVLNFIINEIFGQGAIFLALIACIGLILQKKPFSEVVRGTIMTAVGFFVLSTGTGLITGNSIDGISTAFNAVMPQAVASKTVDISAEYGTEIARAMGEPRTREDELIEYMGSAVSRGLLQVTSVAAPDTKSGSYGKSYPVTKTTVTLALVQ